jgi:hypothetical protein
LFRLKFLSIDSWRLTRSSSADFFCHSDKSETVGDERVVVVAVCAGGAASITGTCALRAVHARCPLHMSLTAMPLVKRDP